MKIKLTNGKLSFVEAFLQTSFCQTLIGRSPGTGSACHIVAVPIYHIGGDHLFNLKCQKVCPLDSFKRLIPLFDPPLFSLHSNLKII